jgi:hypothetical protein
MVLVLLYYILYYYSSSSAKCSGCACAHFRFREGLFRSREFRYFLRALSEFPWVRACATGSCVISTQWGLFTGSDVIKHHPWRHQTSTGSCGISDQMSPVGLPLEGWDARMRDRMCPIINLCSCRSVKNLHGSFDAWSSWSSLYTASHISRRWTWSWSDQEWRWNQSRAYIGKVSYYDGCNWLFLFVSCFLIGSFFLASDWCCGLKKYGEKVRENVL